MKYLPVLPFLVSLIACESSLSDRRAATESTAVPVSEVKAETAGDQPGPSVDARSLIKTANYRFQVETVDIATRKIEAMVSLHEGTIADMDLVTNSSEVSNTIVIRVPSANFEKLMDELVKNSLFTNYKKISAQDVTEEFVDIESRLNTKKQVRDRYVEILRNRARTVDEVLKAEEQIRNLQEEIEAKEGRLKYLQNRVSMSTINLEIYQHVAYATAPDIYEEPYVAKVKDAFSNGWTIVTMLSLFLINIWPLIIIGIVVFGGRKWLRAKLMASR